MRPPFKNLASVVGTTAAAALSRECGGDFLDVPIRLPSSPAEVAQLQRLGLTINEIVAATGRPRTSVVQMLRRARREVVKEG